MLRSGGLLLSLAVVCSSDPGEVVVANCVNEGFFSFFLNWAHHYYKRANLRYPVHTFAEDHVAWKLLLAYKAGIGSTVELTVHKYKDVSGNTTNEVVPKKVANILKKKEARESRDDGFLYGTVSFRNLVGQRSSRLLFLLQQGFTVIYSDVDSVLLRDPMDYAVGPYDVWWAVDRETLTTKKKFPNYCTGFSIMKPSTSVKMLLVEHMRRTREGMTHGQEDQTVMNDLLNGDWAKKAGLRSTGLPRTIFPNGVNYWNGIDEVTKRPLGLDKSKCVWVHANYVIGKAEKVKRLRTAGLWSESDLDQS